MSGLEGSARNCGEKGEEVVYGENLGFCVKVLSGGSLHAASGNAEGGVLKSVVFFHVGVGSIGEPDGSSVEKYGSDNGFVCDDYGFLLLAPVGASKSFENVEAGGDAGDEIVNVWAKGEVGVEGDSQETGVSFEWEGVVVKSDLWCRVGLSFVGCE